MQANEKEAYLLLNRYGKILTRQELKTIKGQIKNGNAADAIVGLRGILRKCGVTIEV